MKKPAEKALSKAKAAANEVLVVSKKAPGEVNDGASAELASEILVKISGARKACDKARKDATKPARDETDEINGAFNEIINALKGHEAALKEQLDKWEEEQERKVEEERQKAEEEAARKQVEEDEQAHEEGRESEIVEQQEVEEVGALQVGGGTVGGTKTWTAEIEDVEEIPYEFLITLVKGSSAVKEAIEVELRKYAKKYKDKAEVPGVKFSRKRHRTIR